MVAAAVIGGAVIGGVGSSIAGGKAASASRHASDQAAQVQREALEQQKELSAPYRQLGEAAMPNYENLLGIGTGGSAGIQQALESTPGYQFALEQGQRGIANLASTQGGISGNTLADLTKFNQGIASTTYQQQLDNLARAVGTGQAAAAGQAQNVGASAANIGNILAQEGQTQACISANTIAGITRSIGTAADQYMQNQALNALNNQGGGFANYPVMSDIGINYDIGYPAAIGGG